MKTATLLLIGLGLISCHAPVEQFDGDRAFNLLQQQCDLGVRAPGTAGHAAARELLMTFLRPLADTLFVQEFDHYIEREKETLHLTNIIAGFQPERAKPLLLGAHWDTRPRADHDPDPLKRLTPILGANDGASGTAVLLHLAEILKAQSPPRAIWLVFFDGEDYGWSGNPESYCIGSRYFARTLPIPKPVEAIIVDMVGDANLSLPIERNSYRSHPKLVRTLWDLAKKRGYSEFVYTLGDEIYDDHLMLIEHARIPSVDIIDFQYPDRYTNYWHTTADTPDKCSPRSLKIVGQVLVDYIFTEAHE